MQDKTLANRLKSLREQKGYLQKFVADKINVKSNTLSGYENGTRSPDPETIKLLAELYGVSSDYLLGIESNPDTLPPFEDFIDDEDLIRWYKELPKDGEENLRRLRRIYEAYKED